MTDTLSPINLALQAVGELFSSPLTFKAYTDDSSHSLNQLPKTLSAAEVPVLIRMGTKAAKNQEPYAEVLGQFLKEKNFGISGSVHSIVSDLLQYQQIGDKSKLPDGLDLSKLEIENTEITEDTRFEEASQKLLQWAKLESCLASSSSYFCRLAGGIRPIVYVFDDYNNFLDKNDPNRITPAHIVILGLIWCKKSLLKEAFRYLNSLHLSQGYCNSQIYTVSTKYNEISKEDEDYQRIEEYYKQGSSSQAKTLCQALDGFYLCLNHLALAFDVQAPDMRFIGSLDNRYQEVARLLNFQKLDQQRNQISAFIIDLEWLPSPEWILKNPTPSNPKPDEEHMGNIAVRLLTQRYPEIPCFIFTGMWSIRTLQKSLAVGAAWCFQKPVSHHKGNSSNPEEELNYFNLERHLTEFAQRTYGAYQEIPNPQQFKSCLNPEDNRTFETKIPIDEKFKRLIAHMFTTEHVEVTKILSGGKSGAKTFFVRPTSKLFTEATRFIKVDSWSKIQQEYASYQQIIRPKLNNHIARIIQKPSVIIPASDALDISPLLAGIASSLAGFPENYDQLNPLSKIIEKYIEEKDGSLKIIKILNSTLEFILLPLHKPLIDKPYNLFVGFPCMATGELLDISDDLPEKIDANKKEIKFREYLNKKVTLECWELVGVDDVSILLSHPETQAKVKIKCSSSQQLLKRFGAVWIKSGMRVCINVKIDARNEYIKEKFYDSQKWLPINDGLELEIKNLIKLWNKATDQQLPLDRHPFYYFDNGISDEEEDKPTDGKQTGKFGAIHGDLNLSNILYPGDEETGFLIDFTYAKSEGLVVLDIAWLESQIWNFYLFPNIVELARYFSLSSPRENLEKICRFLSIAIESANHSSNPDILFASKIDSVKEDNPTLIRILNILKSTHSARQLITQNLGIYFNSGEINYALAVSFLQHSRFSLSKETAQSSALVGTQSFLCASYYLDRYIKEIERNQRPK